MLKNNLVENSEMEFTSIFFWKNNVYYNEHIYVLNYVFYKTQDHLFLHNMTIGTEAVKDGKLYKHNHVLLSLYSVEI